MTRPTLGDRLDTLGRSLVQRRGIALGVVVLVTVLTQLALGLRVARDGLPLDFTPQALFLDKGAQVDALRRIEATFGREDNDLMLIFADMPPTEATVSATEQIHEALAAHPHVESVASPWSATVLVDEDGALQAIAPLADQPPAQALATLAADSALSRLLISEDGTTLAVRVRVSRDLERIADLAPVVKSLTASARAVPLPPGASLHATGVPYVRTEVVDRMVGDQALFVPLVGSLFALTIAVLFRRFLLGLAPLVAVVVADVWALGVLIGGGATLNVLSVLVPTLVLVIGVADGIHITARYREELESGQPADAAMGATLRTMTLPCFLTTFTTGAGFASLLVAETSVIRDFGTHSAIAMVACFFGVISVLPVLLAWIPPAWIIREHTGPDSESRALRWIDGLVARRPALMMALSLAAALGIGALGRDVHTDSHLTEMYREGSDTWNAIALAEQELSGVVPVFFHLQADEADAWRDPELLKRLDTLEQDTLAEPAVLWTASLAGYVRQLHATLSDGRTELPESRAAVSQELLVGELAGGAPLSGVLSEDGSQARILVLLSDAGGRAYLPMAERLRLRAAEIFEGTAVTATLTGDGLLAAAGIDRLIKDLLSSLALMFVVILVTLALLLRDLRLALVACIPNAVPLFFTLGTLGLIGADLQTSNVISFTVAVGLAVDDTIHFVVRYRAERLAGKDVPQAISATFHGAGHPIVLTSLLLVAGFGVLTQSDLTSTRHFGLLSSVTMGAALVGDLLLLPAMLHLGHRLRGGSRADGSVS